MDNSENGVHSSSEEVVSSQQIPVASNSDFYDSDGRVKDVSAAQELAELQRTHGMDSMKAREKEMVEGHTEEQKKNIEMMGSLSQDPRYHDAIQERVFPNGKRYLLIPRSSLELQRDPSMVQQEAMRQANSPMFVPQEEFMKSAQTQYIFSEDGLVITLGLNRVKDDAFYGELQKSMVDGSEYFFNQPLGRDRKDFQKPVTIYNENFRALYLKDGLFNESIKGSLPVFGKSLERISAFAKEQKEKEVKNNTVDDVMNLMNGA